MKQESERFLSRIRSEEEETTPTQEPASQSVRSDVEAALAALEDLGLEGPSNQDPKGNAASGPQGESSTSPPPNGAHQLPARGGAPGEPGHRVPGWPTACVCSALSCKRSA